MKRFQLVHRALQSGATGMLTGVGLGAFGAHGLRGALSPRMLEVYQTAVQYQMVHSLALLIVGGICLRQDFPLLTRSYRCFGWGIVLFSGSLYALVASSLILTESLSWLGIITPIGGLLFIAGWLLMLIDLQTLKR